MSKSAILAITPIKNVLELKDPFIFTAHHVDYYPAGNEELGPVHPPKNGEFSMYHGETVPGFPAHPHTGFETISIVEQGYVDHFDSLGNSGRYSVGDTQWVTTGNGLEHCEMFPLVNTSKENTLELFQIWLNSSPEQKKKDPEYKMFWKEQIPYIIEENEIGFKSKVRVISGHFRDTNAISRPPYSWAAADENKVNIFLIQLDAQAEIVVPATSETSNRFCYFYQGDDLFINGEKILVKHLVQLKPDEQIHLEAGSTEVRILWLEGEPIGAPIAQYGPFVLNSNEELQEAFTRYRATGFGGWPWERPDPVFTRDIPRYSSYEGGKREEFPEKDFAD